MARVFQHAGGDRDNGVVERRRRAHFAAAGGAEAAVQRHGRVGCVVEIGADILRGARGRRVQGVLLARGWVSWVGRWMGWGDGM